MKSVILKNSNFLVFIFGDDSEHLVYRFNCLGKIECVSAFYDVSFENTIDCYFYDGWDEIYRKDVE